ncbi:MAG: hypothetical protein QW244_02505 [Candidatus Pacearchaeota archaeon]
MTKLKRTLESIIFALGIALGSLGLTQGLENQSGCPRAEDFWSKKESKDYKTSVKAIEYSLGTEYTIVDPEIQTVLSNCLNLSDPVTLVFIQNNSQEIFVKAGGYVYSLQPNNLDEIKKLIDPKSYGVLFKGEKKEMMAQEVKKKPKEEEIISEQVETIIKEKEKKEKPKPQELLQIKPQIPPRQNEIKIIKPSSVSFLGDLDYNSQGIVSYDAKVNVGENNRDNIEVFFFGTGGRKEQRVTLFGEGRKGIGKGRESDIYGDLGISFEKKEKGTLLEMPMIYHGSIGWKNAFLNIEGNVSITTKMSRDDINETYQEITPFYEEDITNNPFEIRTVTQGDIETFINVNGKSKTDELLTKARIKAKQKIGRLYGGIIGGIEESRVKNKLDLVEIVNNKTSGTTCVYINGEEVSCDTFEIQNYDTISYSDKMREIKRVFPIGASLEYKHKELELKFVPLVNIGPNVDNTDHVEGILNFAYNIGPNSLIINYFKDDANNKISLWYGNNNYFNRQHKIYLNYLPNPEGLNKINDIEKLLNATSFYGGVDVNFDKNRPNYGFTFGYGNEKWGVESKYSLDTNQNRNSYSVCSEGKRKSWGIFGCGEMNTVGNKIKSGEIYLGFKAKW